MRMRLLFSFVWMYGGILISFAWSSAVLAAEMKWNINDVSYLFPLPDGDENAALQLISPYDEKTGSDLLPKSIYQKIPTLYHPGNGNATLYQNALRVMSVRIDPCPSTKSHSGFVNVDSNCIPEVRFIWQPVEYDQYLQQWQARDAAVHCFYRLNKASLSQLLSELWALKSSYARLGVTTRNKPLGVHPALLNPATAMTFKQKLQQILLRYVDKDNLEKVTFTSLLVPLKWWRFGAFEKDSHGRWTRSDIPLVDSRFVDIFNTAVIDKKGQRAEYKLDAIFNILAEEYPDSDNIFEVINKSYRFNDDRDRKVFKEKLNTIARFRNPDKTNSETHDCASCHFADVARFYILNRYPELAKTELEDQFTNPDPAYFNLENHTITKANTRVVRAFGFHGREPSVSQRTIFDSAVSAHWLNKNMMPLSRGQTLAKNEN